MGGFPFAGFVGYNGADFIAFEGYLKGFLCN